MTRKKTPAQPVAPLTREQKIAQALSPKQRNHLRESPLETIPAVLRTFEPGEAVGYGNRDNVVVVQSLDEGKTILVEMDVIKDRHRGSEPATVTEREFQVAWWFELRKAGDRPRDVDRLMRPELRGSLVQSSLDSVIHLVSHGGLVLDPRFQRGYVWTQDDADQLIDSVFDRLNIGSFVFVRNAGYLHENSEETVTYRNLDGTEFTLPRRNDYTVSVIDGQQRLTTLLRFYMGSLLWRGRSFRSLHFHDQHEFYSTAVSYRMIEEKQVNEKELYRMFLQVNRGVPQSQEHLRSIREKLAKLEACPA